MLNRTLSLFFYLLLLATSAYGQRWIPTNGPYLEVADRVIVDNHDHVIISTPAAVLIGTLPALSTLRTIVDWGSATDMTLLNDGSAPVTLWRDRYFDTTSIFKNPQTNNASYAVTWTGRGSLLAAVQGIGLERLRAGQTKWDTLSDAASVKGFKFLRADIAGPIYSIDSTGAIRLSTDDGETWTLRSSFTTTILCCCVAPDASVLCGLSSGLFRSTDSGRTFSQIALPQDADGVTSISAFRERIAVCTTIGAYLSSDRGANWERLVGPYDTTDASSIALCPNREDIFVGCRRSGLWHRDPNQTWSRVPVRVSCTDYVRMLAPVRNRVIVATRTDGVYSSEDRGSYWKLIHLSYGDYVQDMAAYGQTILVASDRGIVRSTDGGMSFDSARAVSGLRNVQQIVVDKAGYFYALVRTGNYPVGRRCFRSTDGGRLWTEVVATTGRYINAVEVDSANQILLFCGRPFGGAVEPELYVSTNSGDSWTIAEAPYFVRNWSAFACAPNGRAYVNTEYGTFRSGSARYDDWSEYDHDRNRFCFRTGDDFYCEARYGIEHTSDGGSIWQPLPQISPYRPNLLAYCDGALYGYGDVIYRFDENAAVRQRDSDSSRITIASTDRSIDVESRDAISSVELRDICGRTILVEHPTALTQRVTLENREIAPGCYFVIVTTSGLQHVFKALLP